MAAMGNALCTASLPTGQGRKPTSSVCCRRPWRNPCLFLVDHAVDGRELRACFLNFPLGAERVSLVEKLIDLLLIGIAQGICVDLGLHGFVDARDLIAALIIGRLFVNGISSPPPEAEHAAADHDTPQHFPLSPSKFVKSLSLTGVKVCFDYGSSLRAAGWK